MKYLLPLALFLLPVSAFAMFNWTMGQPGVVYDATSTTDPTRFDWSMGQPSVVYDATYSATPPATPTLTGAEDVVWWE